MFVVNLKLNMVGPYYSAPIDIRLYIVYDTKRQLNTGAERFIS